MASDKTDEISQQNTMNLRGANESENHFRQIFEKRIWPAFSAKVLTSCCMFLLKLEPFQLSVATEPTDFSEIVNISIALLILGRIVLLFWAIKDQRICKLFFYCEILVQIVGHMQPNRFDSGIGDCALAFWMLNSLLNFTFLYTNFAGSLGMSLVSLFVMRLI